MFSTRNWVFTTLYSASKSKIRVLHSLSIFWWRIWKLDKYNLGLYSLFCASSFNNNHVLTMLAETWTHEEHWVYIDKKLEMNYWREQKRSKVSLEKEIVDLNGIFFTWLNKGYKQTTYCDLMKPTTCIPYHIL